MVTDQQDAGAVFGPRVLSENSIALVKRAFAEGYDEKDIAYVVKYSEHLSALGLPVIFDANHLSLLTGFKTHFLYGMANRPDRSYRAFTVAKRDGSAREILAPMPDLKALQRWIAVELAGKMPVSKFAHAFRSGRSIKTNARLHLRKRYVVRVDVRDFFGSTLMGKIEEIMIGKGYTKPLSS